MSSKLTMPCLIAIDMRGEDIRGLSFYYTDNPKPTINPIKHKISKRSKKRRIK